MVEVEIPHFYLKKKSNPYGLTCELARIHGNL